MKANVFKKILIVLFGCISLAACSIDEGEEISNRRKISDLQYLTLSLLDGSAMEAVGILRSGIGSDKEYVTPGSEFSKIGNFGYGYWYAEPFSYEMKFTCTAENRWTVESLSAKFSYALKVIHEITPEGVETWSVADLKGTYVESSEYSATIESVDGQICVINQGVEPYYTEAYSGTATAKVLDSKGEVLDWCTIEFKEGEQSFRTSADN